MLGDQVSQLLRVLVATHPPQNILEIGTGVGYSGHILLDSAPATCQLHTIELDEVRGQKAKEQFKNSGLANRATVFIGDAREIVPNLMPAMGLEFDIILMDGPKSCYKTFLPDFDRLLKKDGILICDNVLLKGNISGETEVKDSVIIRNMRAFLQDIQQPPWISSVLNIGDGISISIKK